MTHCPNLDTYPTLPLHLTIDLQPEGYCVIEECHQQRVSPYVHTVGGAAEHLLNLAIPDTTTPRTEDAMRENMFHWLGLIARGPFDMDRAWVDLVQAAGHWVGVRHVPIDDLYRIAQRATMRSV